MMYNQCSYRLWSLHPQPMKLFYGPGLETWTGNLWSYFFLVPEACFWCLYEGRGKWPLRCPMERKGVSLECLWEERSILGKTMIIIALFPGSDLLAFPYGDTMLLCCLKFMKMFGDRAARMAFLPWYVLTFVLLETKYLTETSLEMKICFGSWIQKDFSRLRKRRQDKVASSVVVVAWGRSLSFCSRSGNQEFWARTRERCSIQQSSCDLLMSVISRLFKAATS